MSLVDRLVFPLSAGVQPGALLLSDVDGDGDNEIVVGALDGTISVFKGRSPLPLQVLTGFGPIVAVAHRALETTQRTTSNIGAPAATQPHREGISTAPVAIPLRPQPRSLLLRSPPIAPSSPVLEPLPLPVAAVRPPSVTCGSRLLVVNSEGDLFVLEISRARMRMLARVAELQMAEAEGRNAADEYASGGRALSPEEERLADASAEWADAEENASESAAERRKEPYATSSFLSSHQRFRVPINVSSMVRRTHAHDARSRSLGSPFARR